MQMKRWAGQMALIAGLLMGCGGVEAEELALETQEGALATCPRQRWYDYYSDSSYRTLVGQVGCACGSAPVAWGRRSMHVIEQLPEMPCP